jgi:hypothetical protein
MSGDKIDTGSAYEPRKKEVAYIDIKIGKKGAIIPVDDIRFDRTGASADIINGVLQNGRVLLNIGSKI